MTVNTATSNLRLTDTSIPLGFIQYGSTYSIQVGVWNTTFGDWVYGAVCHVSTPATPINNPQGDLCGGSLSYGAQISTYALSTYTYRWRITNISTSAVVTFDTPTNAFIFKATYPGPSILATSGFITANTSYRIEMALIFQSAPTEIVGNYGPAAACEFYVGSITPRPAYPIEVDQSLNFEDFTVVAYPNPSHNDFSLRIQGKSNEVLSVKVWDVLGHLIDQFEIKINQDFTDLQIGSNYASGVYNVTVSNGDLRRTIRLIKN